MQVASRVLRILSILVMTLIVAGIMLAVITGNEHQFFVSLFFTPIAIILHGASSILDPRRQSNAPLQRPPFSIWR